MNLPWKLTRVAAAVCLLVGTGSSRATAATAQTQFLVTATVTANCSITASGINFTYDPMVANATAAATASGTVTIACTKGAGPTIGLNAGVNGGKVTGVSRAMLNGSTNFLGYELNQPAAPVGTGAVWTDIGTTGAFNPGASTGKAPRTFQVNATIPAGQDVAVGSYTDTITATVNF
jgi:spore coat protein U-like protein